MFAFSVLSQIFGDANLLNFTQNWQCSGISTDTRTLKSGELFVALCGENFDGHSLLTSAFERGAAGVLIEHEKMDLLGKLPAHFPAILTENSLHALGKFANFHRKRFSIPIVAIAGAAGKTTTKEMTFAVLSQKFFTLKTEGNFNNQVGTPLTLLRLTEKHEAAVIEIGTNEPGEIEILAKMVAPTHGLITNIGKEHLEKLIDLDGVEREETALFRYLSANAGTAIVNLGDERLAKFADAEKTISYGFVPDADVAGIAVMNQNQCANLEFSFGQNVGRAELLAVGQTSAQNALTASAVGFALGLTPYEIARGLAGFKPAESHGYGRMVVENVRGITLLNDCYNANPESMISALETLAGMNTQGKKIAVLGDMRELGAASFDEHRDLLLKIAEKNFDFVCLIGAEMKKACDSLEKSNQKILTYYETKQECAEFLLKNLNSGDAILVKGSRGMKMEEIIGILR